MPRQSSFYGHIANIIEPVRIALIRRKQSKILKRLKIFLSEQEEYAAAEITLDTRFRADIRRIFREVVSYDRTIRQIDRYAARMQASGHKSVSVSHQLRDIQDTSSKLEARLDTVKSEELRMLDTIIESELNEEMLLNQTTRGVRPADALAQLAALKKEVKGDEKFAQLIKNSGTPAEDSATSRKIKEAEANLPVISNRYRTMLKYLEKINDYYVGELRIRKEIENLEDIDAVLNTQKNNIMGYASGVRMTGSVKSSVVNQLKSIQNQRTAYNDDIERINGEIDKFEKVFREFEDWYQKLDEKPKELADAYSKAVKTHTTLHAEPLQVNERSVIEIAQAIEMVEGIPVSE